MPRSGTGKWQVQVGSYTDPRNAATAMNAILQASGLMAASQRIDGWYRVFLRNVDAEFLPSLAEMLGNAGFPELWVYQE
jgi:cell division protein FtsN